MKPHRLTKPVPLFTVTIATVALACVSADAETYYNTTNGTTLTLTSPQTYSGPTTITGGGVLRLSGAQTITSYTTTGTTSWNAPSGIGDVRYLVVGGGGGGGGASTADQKGGGGGGGAGGFLTGSISVVSGTLYTITVGGGGAGGADIAAGTNGQDSVFGSITAFGGGGGGSGLNKAAGSGGSGGGGSGGSTTAPIITSVPGGAGILGQGNNGGSSYFVSPGYPAGGGGGAGAIGNTSTNANLGGNGGAGLSSDITGTLTWYAGGGGGGIANNAGGGTGSANSGLGGKGGGGKGGTRDTNYPQYYSGTSGLANTGGGGGGAGRIGFGTSGAGGSGIVVLSYSNLASNVLPAATALSITSGTSLDLYGGAQTVASLSDSGGSGGSVINSYVGYASTLTLNPDSGSTTTFSGVIGGGGGGAISLVKTGAGTQVLAGTNTYTGATTVNAGKLLINGGISGGGTVTVANGATLGGTGSISGPVIVNGILSPGASIESLSTGALTLNGGSTFAYELNSSAAAAVAGDFQKVFGNLTLSGTVTLGLTDLAATPTVIAGGTTLSLINYTGAWNGGFFIYDGTTLTNNSTFTAGLNTWRINYDAISGGLNFASESTAGHFVTLTTLTSVPEPGSLLALGCLVGSGFLLRRKNLGLR